MANLKLNMPACCKIGNDLFSEIQVIPFGTHETDKGAFTLDGEGASEVLKDFCARANDMVIDYEHQSLGGEIAPAAGWIKKLVDKGSLGLWAVAEWTPRALEHLKNREYRYLSPVFMKRVSDGRVVRLLSAALTNTPAIDGMVPLVNKNQGSHAGGAGSPLHLRKEVKDMKRILSALGLTAGATKEEALKSIEALKSKSHAVASCEVLEALGLDEKATVSETVGAVLAMKQATETLKEVGEEMAELRAQVSMNEGTALVSQAMSEGKITPAQREWALAYAGRDPEGFRVFVSRSPVLVPKDRVRGIISQTSASIGGELQVSVNRLLMVSDETFNKFSNRED